MKCFRFLDKSEVLKKGDKVRLIVETGEDGGFDTTYKSENWKPLDWHLVEDEMPGWIDKVIKDFEYHIWYEYIREIKG